MITPAYPTPPPMSDRMVSGGTIAGDQVTATGPVVTVSRTVSPLFIDGSPGELVWSLTVTASAPITSALFRMRSPAARAEVERTGAPASAVLRVRPSGDEVVLDLVVETTAGTRLTLSERVAQQPAVDQPVTLAEPGFGDWSQLGVLPPAASSSLPASEADSPARRSPQVRAAQLTDDDRPDLLPRRSSL